jgi:alkaline phosphatase D
MRLYEVMRRASPDFFIHSGDQIYADGPIQAEVKLADGTLWKNVTTPEKSKVAETLAEYRGNFAYNLLDDHKRRFCAEVPFLVQWDDHEVRNNWYPGQVLGDERYRQRSASLLAAYARRAMFEYNAMRIDPADPERIYRSLSYGPSLDVFMLDERSYRGPNSPNRQTELGDDAAFLGSEQLRWLKRALLASRARPQSRRAEGDARRLGQRRQQHPVRAGARAGEPVVVHQEQCDQERRVGDGRRALCPGDLLQSIAS